MSPIRSGCLPRVVTFELLGDDIAEVLCRADRLHRPLRKRGGIDVLDACLRVGIWRSAHPAGGTSSRVGGDEAQQDQDPSLAHERLPRVEVTVFSIPSSCRQPA